MSKLVVEELSGSQALSSLGPEWRALFNEANASPFLSWEWITAFAPEGFYEIWGILPGVMSLMDLGKAEWQELSRGVLNTQRFYRSLCRNGYNLGLLVIENGESHLELRVVILARSNYAPWVRNDHTGFEVMYGDMATFTAPEIIADQARPFWENPAPSCHRV